MYECVQNPRVRLCGEAGNEDKKEPPKRCEGFLFILQLLQLAAVKLPFTENGEGFIEINLFQSLEVLTFATATARQAWHSGQNGFVTEVSEVADNFCRGL